MKLDSFRRPPLVLWFKILEVGCKPIYYLKKERHVKNVAQEEVHHQRRATK